MAERTTIALIYHYNENWIGGTYYIENLIQAFNCLPDADKPALTIIYHSQEELTQLQQRVNYPKMEYLNIHFDSNVIERLVNKCFRYLTKRNLIEKRKKGAPFDLIYPIDTNYFYQLLENKAAWIPDFQEEYLPQFFTPEEIANRKNSQKRIAQTSEKIVFSSQDAYQTFQRLYPNSKSETYVIPFAVTHPEITDSREEILAKYNLEEDYFICSNQFWKHKNHLLILKALTLFKDRTNRAIKIIFTGKPYDFRAPEHYQALLDYCEYHHLNESIRFLGFIPRADQLALMKYSKSVIQPSLFEGWGTVIEDAKALNLPIYASNIAIHYEQLETYPAKSFFDPEDPEDLYNLLLKEPETKEIQYDYKNDIKRFAQNFLKLTKS